MRLIKKKNGQTLDQKKKKTKIKQKANNCSDLSTLAVVFVPIGTAMDRANIVHRAHLFFPIVAQSVVYRL